MLQKIHMNVKRYSANGLKSSVRSTMNHEKPFSEQVSELFREMVKISGMGKDRVLKFVASKLGMTSPRQLYKWETGPEKPFDTEGTLRVIRQLLASMKTSEPVQIKEQISAAMPTNKVSSEIADLQARIEKLEGIVATLFEERSASTAPKEVYVMRRYKLEEL